MTNWTVIGLAAVVSLVGGLVIGAIVPEPFTFFAAIVWGLIVAFVVRDYV